LWVPEEILEDRRYTNWVDSFLIAKGYRRERIGTKKL